ncbi:hypothetical protein LZ32DRAFT_603201 [Colletotrichum eremochloae]|nr:hypothetical protein LZ32DRAFT_603201 [Colletotrichum eremochloae]
MWVRPEAKIEGLDPVLLLLGLLDCGERKQQQEQEQPQGNDFALFVNSASAIFDLERPTSWPSPVCACWCLLCRTSKTKSTDSSSQQDGGFLMKAFFSLTFFVLLHVENSLKSFLFYFPRTQGEDVLITAAEGAFPGFFFQPARSEICNRRFTLAFPTIRTQQRSCRLLAKIMAAKTSLTWATFSVAVAMRRRQRWRQRK